MMGPLDDASSLTTGVGAHPTRRSLRPWLLLPTLAALLFLPPTGGVLALVGLGVAAGVLLWLLWPVGPVETPPRWFPGLVIAVAGTAMLVGLVVMANPWFGTGIRDWPWRLSVDHPHWAGRFDVGFWAVVGSAALLVGLARPRAAWPYALLLALGVFVAARGHSAREAKDVIRFEGIPLIWTLGVSAMTGGLALLASSATAGRATARRLALAGLLAMASVAAMSFRDEGTGPRWVGSYLVEHWPSTIEAWWKGGELDPETRKNFAERLWFAIAPFFLQAVAAALTLLAVVWPARRPTRLHRYLASLAWLTLLLVWVLPLRAENAFDFPALPGMEAPPPWAVWSRLFLRTSMPIALLLGGAAAVLLTRLRADGIPAVRLRHEEGSAAPRWPYFAGALLGLALVVHAFRPGSGVVHSGSLSDLLVPFRWIPETATLVLLGLLVGASMLAYFRPTRPVRGWLPATLALVAWALLPPGDPTEYGVNAYVGTGASILVAAALWAGALGSPRARRAARVSAGAGSLLLLLLLLYPIAGTAMRLGGEPPFELPLTRFLELGRSDAEGIPWDALTLPWRANVLLQLVLVGLGLAYAASARPRGPRVAVGAVTLGLVFGTLRNGLTSATDLASALYGLGESLRVLGIPMAFVALAATQDLHRLQADAEPPGSPGRSPEPDPTR